MFTMRSAFAVILIAASLHAQPGAAPAKPSAPLPQIKQNGGAKQMFVDGKPFIMLAGELHNSSASGVEYMRPVWDKLEKMHLNTVIGTVSWELLEPQEGKFDFALVDAQIQEARKRNLRLVLIWFATWKNGESDYVPHWVKSDPQRFPVMQKKPRPGAMRGAWDRGGIGSITPFCEAAMLADAKAFRALIRHIREVDPQHTVIMMQVQNESGLLGDSRDRSPLAESAWQRQVPPELMSYLTSHKSTLLPETLEVWGRNGFKTSGSWEEVFGGDEWADEVFMAWHVARYHATVAEAGKAEMNIPMYANAWLGPQPDEKLPGDWPSGGPVARVHDIWRAAAPSLDHLAPDIYVRDFQGTCALYTRSGNPLFIPEAMDMAGNLFYALGRHSAMGWSPFGIEDLKVDGQVAQAYQLLREMLPQLAAWQAAGRVTGVTVDGDQPETVELGGYRITAASSHRRGATAGGPVLEAGGVSPDARAMPADRRPFALIANPAPDEFLFIGANLTPRFTADDANVRAVISSKDQGQYSKGKWIPGRRLNGDEMGQGLPHETIGMLRIKVVRLPK
jgi:beta-galactosidase GanA